MCAKRNVNTKKCDLREIFVPSDQPEFAERLKAWRERVDLKQEQAAKLLKIGRTYYSRLESGKKKPGRFLEEKFELVEQEPASMLRDELAENAARVREEAKAANGIRSKPSIYREVSRVLRVRRIPLIGWAQAGAAVDFKAVIDWDTFVSVEINDPNAIAVRVRGDSMSPEIVEGNIIVLACSDRAEDEDLICARLRDEGVVLKRLKIVDPEKRLFRLVSVNPAYAPLDRTEDQFLWLYPVDQVIQKKRSKL